MKPSVKSDVIVVGGGPAGLSAALVLGRARRRVIVFDEGLPRNAAAAAIHGYLTRDRVAPLELVAMGRDEAARYGVSIVSAHVRRLFHQDDDLGVELSRGEKILARKILIATGVEDRVPAIPGIEKLYGRSVHHCPYCDGWEWRDRPLAAYGRGRSVAAIAHSLLTWSEDVVVCSDGPARIPPAERERLACRAVEIHERRIAGLDGRGGRLERIVFADGGSLPRAAMFFSTGNHQASRIAVELGCRVTTKGSLWVDRSQCTNVRGVYVAGDASRDVQFVVVAAAEGAKAAVAINAELQSEELERACAAARELGASVSRDVPAADPETRPAPG